MDRRTLIGGDGGGRRLRLFLSFRLQFLLASDLAGSNQEDKQLLIGRCLHTLAYFYFYELIILCPQTRLGDCI